MMRMNENESENENEDGRKWAEIII
jgi:hypothetical protein